MHPNLSVLVAPRDYQAQRQHLYGSDQSLQWFIRQHKTELVEGGALLMIAGSWRIDPERFDAVVRAVGERAARKTLACAA